MTRVAATSRVLAVVGDPIRHSLSPAMHNAAIEALGLDAVYVGIHADTAGIPHVIRAFEAVGIAGNVTLPHKVTVSQLLIRLTPIAKELGAVNTFWPEGGRLAGDNTDVAGFLDAVDRIEGGNRWLLAGTGGSARAVAAGARERRASLAVASRDPARAREFVDWARGLGVDAFPDDGRQVDTVINSTPLGLKPDEALPVTDERMSGATAALDLVYAPGETRWVRHCRDRGMQAADGRVMLVAQGAHAFERFFPDTVAPRDIMTAAVNRGLGE